MSDTFDLNTWWGTQMHGGDPNPYMVGSPHTWWLGQLWWANPNALPNALTLTNSE